MTLVTRKSFGLCLCLPVLVIVLLFYPSPLIAETEEIIEDETCLDCHEDYDQTLRATSHRLSSELIWKLAGVSCVRCHAGAEIHIEDPEPDNILTPAELDGQRLIETCTQCHPAHDNLDNYGFDAHSIQQVKCGSCHQIHAERQSLLLDDRAGFCLKCHDEMTSRFTGLSHHPVMGGELNCLSCHKFVKRHDADLNYDLQAVCRDCHPAQSGPFPYEHSATIGHNVVEGGCLECHQPHSSNNDRLLRQPADQICSQCHFPAGHATAHGGIWMDRDCSLCHVDTHGSFVSNLLLDPDMPIKLGGGDCFNSGCHKLNR